MVSFFKEHQAKKHTTRECHTPHNFGAMTGQLSTSYNSSLTEPTNQLGRNKTPPNSTHQVFLTRTKQKSPITTTNFVRRQLNNNNYNRQDKKCPGQLEGIHLKPLICTIEEEEPSMCLNCELCCVYTLEGTFMILTSLEAQGRSVRAILRGPS